MANEVPFMDLSRQWHQISAQCLPELVELIDKSQFSLGPAVERFEKAFAQYLGVRHAIGVNSGTSALHLALLAAGIGPGDRVLLPAHTFIATAWAPLYVGATPVLCDVETDTGTIDVADAARRLAPSTKAIIPVHLYGQPANVEKVTQFAEQHGLVVIEDACQAHGARYGGRHVGTFGRAGCFSFYPSKNLGAPGEAGAVVTDDDTLADTARMLRSHGERKRYVHARIGFNYRLEGLSGLVLSHKLKRLDAWNFQRKAIAEMYRKGLAGLPLELPVVRHHDHVFHLYVVRTPQRDALRDFVGGRGIATGLHYPVPLNRQPCLDHLAMDRDSFRNSDRWACEGLSLPIFPGMTEVEVERVIVATRAFFQQ